MKLLIVTKAMVRSWVWLYTTGLSKSRRRLRMAEIDSDLWEQTQADGADGVAGMLIALSLLLRCITGIPADLTWRLSGARRLAGAFSYEKPAERSIVMSSASSNFVSLSAVCGLAWAEVLVMVLVPTPHSIVLSGATLCLVALGGWLVEAREQDLADLTQSNLSAWPVLLAVGLTATFAGLIVSAPAAGLAVAGPLALVSTALWLRETLTAPARSGYASQLVSPAVMATHVAAGDAIAIETRDGGSRISRRSVLQGSIWLALAGALTAAFGTAIDFLWERHPSSFGGLIAAGKLSEFPPGSKTKIVDGKFWLVNLDEAQGGPGLLALWQRCPHLGCTIPWEQDYSNPAKGMETKGWFHCPCHSSTYNDAGVLVYGPAPRSMDRMALTVDPQTGAITVDTGDISRGSTENPTFAVRVEQGL